MVTRDDGAGHVRRVSIFTRASQLLGSFTQAGPCRLGDVAGGAATLFLVLGAEHQHSTGRSCILAAAPDGTVTARHGMVQATSWQPSSECEHLLAVSGAGNTLFVCSAAADMQIIDLERPAASADVLCAVSSRNGLAVVSLGGSSPEVLLVDLREQRVRHRQAPPQQSGSDDKMPFQIAQGCQSVALLRGSGEGVQVRVLATSLGPEAGRQLFMIPGKSAAWDCLGRFVAVRLPSAQALSIHDGLSGACLAYWAVPHPVCLLRSVQWVLDGVALRTSEPGRSGNDRLGTVLLTFAGPA